ncbi:PH domain-containing protein [Streptomyces sp. V3I7]|uniref:PH domain-containing protein n=1 Tax=Streptomyces sp. V3I7 TaxID=3042278 RepID=UPI002780C1EF|nr:PH domain-containing protein [Streptomyces sp. V3I7]MDQ0992704.1 hypothetical protein [Streptomyces sp. V3I7]
MTTPDHQPSAQPPSGPTAGDRIYRSPMALVGGALLLAIVLWLGLDALFRGEGRTPWLALASLVLVVPLAVAFTLRPAVFANDDRLRVRNPFRVIVLPWGEVATLRSGFSNEAVAESGAKYQLWAIPVSLGARKKAARRQARAEAQSRGGAKPGRRGLGGLGMLGGGLSAPDPQTGQVDVDSGPIRAETDKVMDELRELRELRGPARKSQGEVTVRWAYEIVAPAVAGAVLLAVLLAIG